MSEKVTRIPLHEVRTLRITCSNCRVAVEAQVLDDLENISEQGRCRFCDSRLWSGKDTLRNLADAIRQALPRDKASIEIVLTEEV